MFHTIRDSGHHPLILESTLCDVSVVTVTFNTVRPRMHTNMPGFQWPIMSSESRADSRQALHSQKSLAVWYKHEGLRTRGAGLARPSCPWIFILWRHCFMRTPGSLTIIFVLLKEVLFSASPSTRQKRRERNIKSHFFSLLKSLCVLTLEVTLLKGLQGRITLQIAQVTLNPCQEGSGTF